MPPSAEQSLGEFLKSRRAKLDPITFGFEQRRRRTPGLRREEVAQRANVSTTWYTWLEQGRGGGPSVDVLNRISNALMLTAAEREHMFILALGRPLDAQPQKSGDCINPRLQHLLNAFQDCPGLIKTASWDIVAWNRPAAVLFEDYGVLEPRERNILRLLFGPHERAPRFEDWEELAQFVVAAFRADFARTGPSSEVAELVEDLCESSANFARIWRENELAIGQLPPVCRHHSSLGLIELQGSIFSVEGRRDLSLVVYCPVRPIDFKRMRALMASSE